MLARRRIAVLVSTMAVVCAAGGPSMQTYDLTWYTIDGGGGSGSSGGEFELSGTSGQPDAGFVMTGGDFELVGGFWPGAQTEKTPRRGDHSSKVDPLDVDPFIPPKP